MDSGVNSKLNEGDYPGLDGLRPKRHPVKRQDSHLKRKVFLVSVGVIVAITFGYGSTETLTTQSGAGVAKVGPMRTIEGVGVMNVAIDIQATSGAFDFRQFYGGKRVASPSMKVNKAIGWNNRAGYWLISEWPDKREIFGKRPDFYRHPTQAFHIMSGRQTQVLNVDFHLYRGCGGRLADKGKFFFGVKENIRPQLSPSCFLRPPYEFAGGIPQVSSKERKSGCDKSQPYGGVTKQPLVSRFFVAFIGFVFGFFLVFLAGKRFYDERPLFRSGLIAVGALFAFLGLGLLLLTAFPWSWGLIL